MTMALSAKAVGLKMMTPDFRSLPMLRNLRITRLVLGLTLSALATFVWVRADMPHFWPKLLDAVTHEPHPIIDHFPAFTPNVGCLSRSQQYKYRKQKNHFPISEPLTRALVKYTRMHSHCQLTKVGDVDSMQAACQYVVYYEGYEGLGNRLLSLVTAFSYALITNRALVIDERRGHLAQLLCQPFHNTSWLLPSHLALAVQKRAVKLQDMINNEVQNVTSVHVNLRHEQTLGDRTFFCSESQELLRKVTWVIWESNQYYVPRLFMIREFWPTLRLWFPNVSLVFTQLGRILSVPRNGVWETIERIQQAEMAWARVQVGIQVRRHGVSDNANFSETVYQRILKCVGEHAVLPNRTTAAVLVTSLRSVYWEKMRERWHGRDDEEGEVKFVMVSEEKEERYSYDQACKAMVEIWLLSFCDRLATSSWSTFGYVAQALAGIQPVIMNIQGEHPELDEQAQCWRGQSVEPCLHYPFIFRDDDSGTAYCISQAKPNLLPKRPQKEEEVETKQQEEHSAWIARHLVVCQDETRGLQLVS